MVKQALDSVGNTATFTHDASLRLTKATDGSGRETTLGISEGQQGRNPASPERLKQGEKKRGQP
jgi:hypothetical protein